MKKILFFTLFTLVALCFSSCSSSDDDSDSSSEDHFVYSLVVDAEKSEGNASEIKDRQSEVFSAYSKALENAGGTKNGILFTFKGSHSSCDAKVKSACSSAESSLGSSSYGINVTISYMKNKESIETIYEQSY